MVFFRDFFKSLENNKTLSTNMDDDFLHTQQYNYNNQTSYSDLFVLMSDVKGEIENKSKNLHNIIEASAKKHGYSDVETFLEDSEREKAYNAKKNARLASKDDTHYEHQVFNRNESALLDTYLEVKYENLSDAEILKIKDAIQKDVDKKSPEYAAFSIWIDDEVVRVDDAIRDEYNDENPEKAVRKNEDIHVDFSKDSKEAENNMYLKKEFDGYINDAEVYIEDEKAYEEFLKSDQAEKPGNEDYKVIGSISEGKDIEVSDPFMQEWIAKEIAAGRDIEDTCELNDEMIYSRNSMAPSINKVYEIKDEKKKEYEKFIDARSKELNDKNRDTFKASRIALVEDYMKNQNPVLSGDINKDNYPGLLVKAQEWEKNKDKDKDNDKDKDKKTINPTDKSDENGGNTNEGELDGWKLETKKFYENWCKNDPITEKPRNPNYEMDVNVTEAGISFNMFASKEDKEAGKQSCTIDYKDQDNVNISTPDGKSADYEAWRAVAQRALEAGQPINLAGITNEENMKKLMLACKALGVNFVGQKEGLKVTMEEAKAFGLPEKDLKVLSNGKPKEKQNENSDEEKTDEDNYKAWLKDEMGLDEEPEGYADKLKEQYTSEQERLGKHLKNKEILDSKHENAKKMFKEELESLKQNNDSDIYNKKELIDIKQEYNDYRKDSMEKYKKAKEYSDLAKDNTLSIDERLDSRKSYADERFGTIEKQQELDQRIVDLYTKKNEGK